MAPRFSRNVTFVLILVTAICNIINLAYDPSMINNLNILPSYLEHFNLDAAFIGLNVAIVSAGSVFAGPFVGSILDRLGRKRGMMVGSAVSLIAIIMETAAPNEACFLVGRFIIGFTMVIAGTSSPLWVMELAHPRHRGMHVGILMSSLPLAGTIVCAIVLGVYQVGSDWAWRGPIMGELLGPVMTLLLAPWLPESPRWLIFQGRKEEALELLIHLHGDGSDDEAVVKKEFEEICETIEYEAQHKVSWKALVSPAPNRRRFLIAVAIQIFFQLSGSNTILYFVTIIIANAGITDTQTVLLINLGVGIWDTLSVVAGGFLLDSVGRKRVLVWGTIMMTLCFVLLAILVQRAEVTGEMSFSIGAIAIVFIYQFFSCASWMILAYSYPPEILKYSQRGKGIAASQAIGYAFSFIDLYIIPIAIENIGWRFYAINAGWNVIIIGIMAVFFVETKGKTLEDIDHVFEKDTTIDTDGLPGTSASASQEVVNVAEGMAIKA